MRHCLFFLFITFFVNNLTAQTQKNNNLNVLTFNIAYAFQTNSGDLADRFGNSFEIDLSSDFITKKNFIFGVRGGVFFGNEVHEDVLFNLRDPDGFLIGNNQAWASIALRERGFYVGGRFGKLFPLLKNNRRSGIRVTLGAGLLQHKIRIQDDGDSAPQISGDYIKGYDRLSNGLALTQFVGYQHMSKNKRINFHLGFEFTEGFTQNRRSLNFDTMMKDETKRTDILLGFKLGWTLVPIYFGQPSEDIYY